jgi:beta-glucosidase
MVLLKNQGNLLPLSREDVGTVALKGPNLRKKFGRLFYGGSSAVKPPYEITPLEGVREKLESETRIINDASEADLAIIFAGLNHDKGLDSETYDRQMLELPDDQVEQINQTASDNPNTVVVLIAGSAIAMRDWIDNVPVVLDAWYAGMESGRAIANVLFGDVCPSGKLPVTFPQQLKDSPAHHSGLARHYPGDEEKRVYYDEGIFVGYRWFDEKEITPLYPFGYGLSYTAFEFGEVQSDRNKISGKDDALVIKVDVENTGKHSGAEVVQIYSHDIQSSVERPPKELVGFEKMMLKPGERGTASIRVKAHDLMFYDVEKHEWCLEPGEYELLIGNSSRDLYSKIMLDY